MRCGRRPVQMSFLNVLQESVLSSPLWGGPWRVGLCYDIARFMFWPHGVWHLSSPTRDGTHIPCIGRQSPNTALPGEAPFWMRGFDHKDWMVFKY